MAEGLPTDDVLRELESRHDELLEQITDLDERVALVLSEYLGTRRDPNSVEEPTPTVAEAA